MSLNETLPPRFVFDKTVGKMVLSPAFKAFIGAQFDAVQAAVKKQNAEMRAGFARAERDDANNASN